MSVPFFNPDFLENMLQNFTDEALLNEVARRFRESDEFEAKFYQSETFQDILTENAI